MNIEPLKPGDDEAWDLFVEHCPTATFFHKAGWKHVIERAFGHPTHYLKAEANGSILGVLPLVRVRSLLFGDALISIPFGVYGGVAATDDSAATALLAAAEDLGRSEQVDYVELRCLGEPQAAWPGKDLYVTFRGRIDPDEAENFKAIPRKQRAMVRKGQERGLSSIMDESTDRFFATYSESVRNLGTPVLSHRYFRLLREQFGEACRVMTVLSEGQPVASVMSFYFRDQVLPFYGGGTARARELYANDFMYWELLRRSCGEGLRVFDFGRSKVHSGSFHFKRHWGFEPEPLHYQYLLVKAKQVPNVSPTNPRYRLMIDAWRRLPLPLANILGPQLARFLG